jgi:hypothetical protein
VTSAEAVKATVRRVRKVNERFSLWDFMVIDFWFGCTGVLRKVKVADGYRQSKIYRTLHGMRALGLPVLILYVTNFTKWTLPSVSVTFSPKLTYVDAGIFLE